MSTTGSTTSRRQAGRKPGRLADWRTADWSLPDDDLAARYGVAVGTVQMRRRQYVGGPKCEATGDGVVKRAPSATEDPPPDCPGCGEETRPGDFACEVYAAGGGRRLCKYRRLACRACGWVGRYWTERTGSPGNAMDHLVAFGDRADWQRDQALAERSGSC